jgi:hypothetical protein
VDGVVLVALRDLVDARRHRRGEQHDLTAVRARREDLLDVVCEAEVEHFVGLVEDDRLEVLKTQALSRQVIERPSGRGDDEVDAAL